MLMNDTVMVYFDPGRKTRLKTDAGPGGIAATMKQYDPEAKRWWPVTYPSRAFTDAESRYLQQEKEAIAVKWGIFANQIYLYGMGNTLEVDTDHKPLVPLLSGYTTTAPLCIEKIRVHLQGFNYRLNYIPGRKEDRGTMKQATIHGIQSHWLCKLRDRPVRAKLNLS